MNLADAEPEATRNPMVKGSALATRRAALEAMNRFDGPANGMIFNRKEVARMPRISKSDASL